LERGDHPRVVQRYSGTSGDEAPARFVDGVQADDESCLHAQRVPLRKPLGASAAHGRLAPVASSSRSQAAAPMDTNASWANSAGLKWREASLRNLATVRRSGASPSAPAGPRAGPPSGPKGG